MQEAELTFADCQCTHCYERIREIELLKKQNAALLEAAKNASYDFDRGWNGALNVMLDEQDVLREQLLRTERQRDRLLAALKSCEQTLLEHIDCARNEAASSMVREHVRAAIELCEKGGEK